MAINVQRQDSDSRPPRLSRSPLRSYRRGQALVEFALIIPIFLLLIFGVIEFGRALHAHLVVTDAVREAGRVAAAADASVDSAGAIALIENRLAMNALDPTLATLSAEIRPNGWPGASGDTVFVAVDYPFQFGLLQAFIGWTGAQATINLRSEMPWRNE